MIVEKKTLGEKTFDTFNVLIMIFMMIIAFYPLWYVIACSLSEPSRLIQHHGILFFPLGFTLKGYQMVLKNPSISSGYLNTIFYVVAGTTLNIFLTSLGAYMLSRKNLMWKNVIMFLITFTMFFNGGLIPTYLLVKGLNLIDSRWAMIIPGAIGTWNLIIMRTSFASIPASLEESARIDGAGEFTILFKIILPLSLPIIAVMILFYGVGHWNAWVGAMMYIRDRSKYPLQLVLREILIMNNTSSMQQEVSISEDQMFNELIKYSTIVISTLPILCIYPFLQKYFVKGVMVGAIKG